MPRRPAHTCLAIAQGLLLQGGLDPASPLHKATLLEELNVTDSSFRKYAKTLGAIEKSRGLRFFDTSVAGHVSFGPGAGLALGISLGTQSLRAALVDVNGWIRDSEESTYEPEQLAAKPRVILERIRSVARVLLDRALNDDGLLVDGALPLLGWGIAWPSPIDRERKPVGFVLSHPEWRKGEPLDRLVEEHFGLNKCYALNDAHAAAIAIAHRQTRGQDAQSWPHHRLGLVLRLGGGVGGGIIIIEKPRLVDGKLQSGFVTSILVAGAENHAGEFGHSPVDMTTVETLKKARRPRGLGPFAGVHCSCVASTAESPAHVEAFASARALAARLDASAAMHEVLQRVLADHGAEPHAQSLRDIGAVVGASLVNLIAVLNPKTITLTGSLAVPAVHNEVAARIRGQHPFGVGPMLVSLENEENAFVCARGAALALIRDSVHRKLRELLGEGEYLTKQRIRALTVKVQSPP